MFIYPQVFNLERPNIQLFISAIPNTDLCNEGFPETTLPPCADNICTEPMPFTPQDFLDIFWNAPNPDVKVFEFGDDGVGSGLNISGLIEITGNVIRINFCNAPPCFYLKINDRCTNISFKRVECFELCEDSPPVNPEPAPVPNPVQALASYVSFEHVDLLTRRSFSANIPNETDAHYSYTRYPNTPVAYNASFVVGVGGSAADHLHETTTGAVVSASVTVGINKFVGWSFVAPTNVVFGYTPTFTYEPAPLPIQIINGGGSLPFVTFVVPPGTAVNVNLLFNI